MKKKNNNKYGFKDDGWFQTMPCPGCGKSILRFINNSDLDVNCESRQKIEVENFRQPITDCTNPFCEWSKLKDE